MLSLFSLQSIPRRLTGDFSDIEKGYSFDSIKGDFTFKDGDANTNNLHFEGPIASISITGTIGLRSKTYDLTIGVTAYGVTSSIPVAAGLIANPLVGLAALAVNTVVGKQISKVATTNYYQITGPWSDPKWESVKSSGKNP